MVQFAAFGEVRKHEIREELFDLRQPISFFFEKLFEDSNSGRIELILVNTVPYVNVAFKHADFCDGSFLPKIVCFVFLYSLHDHLEVLSHIAVVTTSSFLKDLHNILRYFSDGIDVLNCIGLAYEDR